MWVLSVVTAVAAARYFLNPVPGLQPSMMLALARNPYIVRLHIFGGIVAITTGLFQFVKSLRTSRPFVHRAMGFAYLGGVLLGGVAGLGLSPDTPFFAAELMTESKSFDMPLLGPSPSFLGYGPATTFSPAQFTPVMMGFASLALAWLVTSVIAFRYARQRSFRRHSEWMIRSYALTFAAVTIRLAPLPFLFLTRNPVVAITCTFWSWLLNLLVAEWLIRGRSATV